MHGVESSGGSEGRELGGFASLSLEPAAYRHNDPRVPGDEYRSLE